MNNAQRADETRAYDIRALRERIKIHRESIEQKEKLFMTHRPTEKERLDYWRERDLLKTLESYEWKLS